MKTVAGKEATMPKESEIQVLTLSVSLPKSAQVDERTARELLTLSLVQSGHLSQSQAAQVLGISRYDLLDLMGRYDLPVVHMSQSEIEREGRHLDELQAIRSRTPQGESGERQAQPVRS